MTAFRLPRGNRGHTNKLGMSFTINKMATGPVDGTDKGLRQMFINDGTA
jgi:hypothetical protein